MCVGLTIVVVPPTTVLLGYALWSTGQGAVHSWYGDIEQQNLTTTNDHYWNASSDSSNIQNRYAMMSYPTAAVAFVGTYWIQSTAWAAWTGSHPTTALSLLSNAYTTTTTTTTAPPTNQITAQKPYLPPHKAPPDQIFAPPQTMADLHRTFGRPFLRRLLLSSVACGTAGAVQALVVVAGLVSPAARHHSTSIRNSDIRE